MLQGMLCCIFFAFKKSTLFRMITIYQPPFGKSSSSSSFFYFEICQVPEVCFKGFREHPPPPRICSSLLLNRWVGCGSAPFLFQPPGSVPWPALSAPSGLGPLANPTRCVRQSCAAPHTASSSTPGPQRQRLLFKGWRSSRGGWLHPWGGVGLESLHPEKIIFFASVAGLEHNRNGNGRCQVQWRCSQPPEHAESTQGGGGELMSAIFLQLPRFSVTLHNSLQFSRNSFPFHNFSA